MPKVNIHNIDRYVSSAIYQKGVDYFRKKKVKGLDEISPGEWMASVAGSNNTYSVDVHIDDDNITHWSCDCPFDTGDMCKHVVATILRIKEKKGVNSPAPVSSQADRLQAALDSMRKFKKTIIPPEAPAVRPTTVQKIAPEQMMEGYQTRLGEIERKMLKIAAVIWEPFSQTKFIEIYNEAGFRYNGINLYAKDAKILLDGLINSGFLVRSEAAQMRCHEGFATELCDTWFKKDPEFAKICVPVQSRAYYSYWNQDTNGERNFRDMRIARYKEDAADFKTHYFATLQSSGIHTRRSVVRYWLGPVFDLKKLTVFPVVIRAFILSEIMTETAFNLDKTNAYFLYAQDQLATLESDDRDTLARLISQIQLYRGEWKAVDRNYAYFSNLNLGIFTAMQHFISGNNTSALEAFNLSTKEMRRVSRNPKSYLSNLAGIFQILVQLKTQDIGLYAKIADAFTKVSKNPTSYQPVYGYLSAILAFLQNNKPLAITLLAKPPAITFFKFFHFICQYWVDEKMVDRRDLNHYYEMLQQNGYEWLAAETLELLDKVETPSVMRTQTLEELRARLRYAPLVDMLPRIEDWENALNALMSMSAGAKTGSNVKENDSRLIWLVHFEHKTLQPKEQTYGKKGWTSGRNVSLQRLREGELSCITEQDRRIARHIHGWGTYLEMNGAAAMPDLVGHPLLFLWKSPDVAVQFLEEKPVMLVKQSEKGFTLQFSHNIDGEGSNVIKESPTRYKLVNVTAEMARIAKTLIGGKSLFVPEQGAERLKQVVQGLSGIVTVQSALEADNQDVPLVEPDSRICVHLLPVGDGFHVELYTKPFTTAAPYFKPGEGEPSVMSLVDGERKRTNRNLKKEKSSAKELRESIEMLRDSSPRHGTWEVEDAEVCLELLLQLDPLVQAQKIILEWPKGEKFRITTVAGMGQFRVNIREKGNWFEVNGELRVDENKVYNMQELLALSERAKGQFIELSPGKFLALTAEFRRRLKEINGLLTPQKNGSLQLHPLAAPAIQSFTDALQHLAVDKKFKENTDRLRKAFSKRFKLPENFNAELRTYQMEGYEWLNRCAEGGVGACLADDMGLGKTIQALGLLTYRAHLGPALVAAPASVCRNWLKETEKFAPGLQPLLFGEGDRTALVENADKGDLVIVTYDLMTRESDLFTKKKFATIILDEAQSIKNRATKRSETAMQLQGDFRMIMTGTPLENHLGELWNLFQFSNPGLLGSIDNFNERFAVPIERFRDEGRRDQLRRLVQPFILRRRKSEVLKELPEKTEITLTVELTAEERAFYEALRRSAMDKLLNNDSKGGEKHLMILAEIMRLRRAACHPRLVDSNADFVESSKLRLFGEIVDELLDNGHKALVFSQFVAHLGILEAYLKKKGVKYQYLDGQTPLNTRQKRIEAFQGGEGDLFLISLKAGGVGLNLTAADYVVHMDPWWNPAVEDQATDRAHRIGQEKPVTVYRLVAEATIEEKIIKLHEQKRDLADSLLSGSDMSARLSADDLLALIAEK